MERLLEMSLNVGYSLPELGLSGPNLRLKGKRGPKERKVSCAAAVLTREQGTSVEERREYDQLVREGHFENDLVQRQVRYDGRERLLPGAL